MFPSLCLGHREGTDQVVRRSAWSLGTGEELGELAEVQGLSKGRRDRSSEWAQTFPGRDLHGQAHCRVAARPPRTCGIRVVGVYLLNDSASFLFFSHCFHQETFLRVPWQPAVSQSPARLAWFFQLDQKQGQRHVNPWGSQGEISDCFSHETDLHAGGD